MKQRIPSLDNFINEKMNKSFKTSSDAFKNSSYEDVIKLAAKAFDFKYEKHGDELFYTDIEGNELRLKIIGGKATLYDDRSRIVAKFANPAEFAELISGDDWEILLDESKKRNKL